MDSNSIWVRNVREKYVRNDNFFNIFKKKKNFIVWKKVSNYRKYIKIGLK